ncbi:uncharacterized protein DDB_G0283357-like [Antennarius striatus]|uniref:uncharacterized protein DDB_G0283357-like n=1 Tax=Antennarius striatus TaxID=241820 RepID=UPI0035ADE557
MDELQRTVMLRSDFEKFNRELDKKLEEKLKLINNRMQKVEDDMEKVQKGAEQGQQRMEEFGQSIRINDVIITSIKLKPRNYAHAMTRGEETEHSTDYESVEQQVITQLRNLEINIDPEQIETCYPSPSGGNNKACSINNGNNNRRTHNSISSINISNNNRGNNNPTYYSCIIRTNNPSRRHCTAHNWYSFVNDYTHNDVYVDHNQSRNISTRYYCHISRNFTDCHNNQQGLNSTCSYIKNHSNTNLRFQHGNNKACSINNGNNNHRTHNSISSINISNNNRGNNNPTYHSCIIRTNNPSRRHCTAHNWYSFVNDYTHNDVYVDHNQNRNISTRYYCHISRNFTDCDNNQQGLNSTCSYIKNHSNTNLRFQHGNNKACSINNGNNNHRTHNSICSINISNNNRGNNNPTYHSCIIRTNNPNRRHCTAHNWYSFVNDYTHNDVYVDHNQNRNISTRYYCHISRNFTDCDNNQQGLNSTCSYIKNHSNTNLRFQHGNGGNYSSHDNCYYLNFAHNTWGNNKACSINNGNNNHRTHNSISSINISKYNHGNNNPTYYSCIIRTNNPSRRHRTAHNWYSFVNDYTHNDVYVDHNQSRNISTRYYCHISRNFTDCDNNQQGLNSTCSYIKNQSNTNLRNFTDCDNNQQGLNSTCSYIKNHSNTNLRFQHGNGGNYSSHDNCYYLNFAHNTWGNNKACSINNGSNNHRTHNSISSINISKYNRGNNNPTYYSCIIRTNNPSRRHCTAHNWYSFVNDYTHNDVYVDHNQNRNISTRYYCHISRNFTDCDNNQQGLNSTCSYIKNHSNTNLRFQHGNGGNYSSHDNCYYLNFAHNTWGNNKACSINNGKNNHRKHNSISSINISKYNHGNNNPTYYSCIIRTNNPSRRHRTAHNWYSFVNDYTHNDVYVDHNQSRNISTRYYCHISRNFTDCDNNQQGLNSTCSYIKNQSNTNLRNFTDCDNNQQGLNSTCSYIKNHSNTNLRFQHGNGGNYSSHDNCYYLNFAHNTWGNNKACSINNGSNNHRTHNSISSINISKYNRGNNNPTYYSCIIRTNNPSRRHCTAHNWYSFVNDYTHNDVYVDHNQSRNISTRYYCHISRNFTDCDNNQQGLNSTCSYIKNHSNTNLRFQHGNNKACSINNGNNNHRTHNSISSINISKYNRGNNNPTYYSCIIRTNNPSRRHCTAHNWYSFVNDYTHNDVYVDHNQSRNISTRYYCHISRNFTDCDNNQQGLNSTCSYIKNHSNTNLRTNNPSRRHCTAHNWYSFVNDYTHNDVYVDHNQSRNISTRYYCHISRNFTDCDNNQQGLNSTCSYIKNHSNTNLRFQHGNNKACSINNGNNNHRTHNRICSINISNNNRGNNNPTYHSCIIRTNNPNRRHCTAHNWYSFVNDYTHNDVYVDHNQNRNISTRYYCHISRNFTDCDNNQQGLNSTCSYIKNHSNTNLRFQHGNGGNYSSHDNCYYLNFAHNTWGNNKACSINNGNNNHRTHNSISSINISKYNRGNNNPTYYSCIIRTNNPSRRHCTAHNWYSFVNDYTHNDVYVDHNQSRNISTRYYCHISRNFTDCDNNQQGLNSTCSYIKNQSNTNLRFQHGNNKACSINNGNNNHRTHNSISSINISKYNRGNNNPTYYSCIIRTNNPSRRHCTAHNWYSFVNDYTHNDVYVDHNQSRNISTRYYCHISRNFTDCDNNQQGLNSTCSYIKNHSNTNLRFQHGNNKACSINNGNNNHRTHNSICSINISNNNRGNNNPTYHSCIIRTNNPSRRHCTAHNWYSFVNDYTHNDVYVDHNQNRNISTRYYCHISRNFTDCDNNQQGLNSTCSYIKNHSNTNLRFQHGNNKACSINNGNNNHRTHNSICSINISNNNRGNNNPTYHSCIIRTNNPSRRHCTAHNWYSFVNDYTHNDVYVDHNQNRNISTRYYCHISRNFTDCDNNQQGLNSTCSYIKNHSNTNLRFQHVALDLVQKTAAQSTPEASTANPTTDGAVTQVPLTFTSPNDVFTDDLLDSTSSAFQTRATNIKNSLEPVYSAAHSNFDSVDVTGFSYNRNYCCSRNNCSHGNTNNTNGSARHHRSRDNRSRDNRSRDNRSRDNRSRDNRSRDNRSRDNRSRDNHFRRYRVT